MKKPRSDSKLDNLPDHQFMELRDGLLADWSYEKAETWLAVECGVDTSSYSLSKFYQRHCAPVMQSRRQLAVLKAETITNQAKEDGFNWDAAVMERVKQITFELLLKPNVDPKTVKIFGDMLLKDKSLNLDMDKFKESMRDKMQAGLDALSAEIKDNAKAKEIFAELQEVIG